MKKRHFRVSAEGSVVLDQISKALRKTEQGILPECEGKKEGWGRLEEMKSKEMKEKYMTSPGAI